MADSPRAVKRPEATLPLGPGRDNLPADLTEQGGNPMALRSRIADDLKAAIKARDQLTISTLRLIHAAIKDRDIALRGEGEDRLMSDAEILSVLARMVKMRQESVRAYEEGGRLELVEREQAEIAVIESYLPRQLDDAETEAAIDGLIAELEVRSIRDMGRLMAALRERYTGQMDFGRVGPLVKARLAGG